MALRLRFLAALTIIIFAGLAWWSASRRAALRGVNDSRGMSAVPSDSGSAPPPTGFPAAPASATSPAFPRLESADTMDPDGQRALLVEDEHGRPKPDAPIEIWGSFRYGEWRLLLALRTDSDGRANVPTWSASDRNTIPSVQNPEPEVPDSALALVAICQLPRTTVEYAPRAAGAPEIRITLPATREFAIEFVDQSGRPVLHNVLVDFVRGDERPPTLKDLQWCPRFQTASGRIEINLSTDFRGGTPHPWFRSPEGLFPDSGIPGNRINLEPALIRIQLDLEGPALTGRLLDAGGTPFAHEALDLECRPSDGSDGVVKGAVRTDALGRFRLPLPIEREESLRVRVVSKVHPDAGSYLLVIKAHDNASPDFATAVLAARLMTDGTELGDVVLALPPRVASGVVQDEDGQPVPLARVLLKDADRPEAEVTSITVADRNGTFEVRGPITMGKFGLATLAGGLVGGPLQRFEPGEENLVLVMSREAPELRRRILLPPKLSWDGVGVIATGTAVPGAPTSGRPRGGDFAAHPLEGSDVLCFRGLRRGTLDLWLVLAGDVQDDPIAQGIDVASEPPEPADIAVIDLRGRILDWYVKVTGVDHAFVLRIPRDGRTGLRQTASSSRRDQPARIRGITNQFEFAAFAPGHRAARYTTREEHTNCTLRPGIPVHLVLEGLEFPPDGFGTAIVEFRPAETETTPEELLVKQYGFIRQSIDLRRSPTVGRGQRLLDLVVGVPGLWRLGIVLRSDIGSRTTPMIHPDWIPVEVKDGEVRPNDEVIRIARTDLGRAVQLSASYDFVPFAPLRFLSHLRLK